MKLLIVLPHLRGGGAQRVAVNLINYLDRDIALNLFLINNDGFLIDYIEKDIKIIASKSKKTRKAIYELRALIDKNRYDAVFTMKDYLGLMLSVAVWLTKTRPPIIYREVIHKSTSGSFEINNKLKRKVWHYLERYVFNKVKIIIVPSEAMKQDLIINYAIDSNKIRVINNPVDINLIEAMADQAVDHPWFESSIPVVVGMGRLTGQKGFRELINAFNLVNKKNINLRLVIIGDGEERPRLKKLVDELQLNDVVDF